MADFTRRNFLKVAAMLSGTAGVSGFIPESIQRAMAIEPAPGSSYLDAEHIVILMQENRSFDHALGTLQGVRGFNDPRALRMANGNSVFAQSDAAGNTYAPWRLDIRDTRITWMGSIPHTRHSQVDAWNEGHHDGWLDAKRSKSPEYAQVPMTMGHYTREDLPFYYALADGFTVCDQSYCSVMSSTTPNRCMFWTGTIRDEQKDTSKVYMRNEEVLIGGMPWDTFPERLQNAGVDWKFYQNELTAAGGLSGEKAAWLANFGCNVLEYFAAYNIEAYPGAVIGMQETLAAIKGKAAKTEHALASTTEPRATKALRARLGSERRHIEKLETALKSAGELRYKELTAEQRALHDAAFVTNETDKDYRSLETIAFDDDGPQEMKVPKGDILHQFRKDVDEGKLPTVSWLTAPEKFSDHPTSPWYGAWYVSEVMDILTKNPEVWKKTIFILTYDENDGYFDHAPSFVAADPKRPQTGGASKGIDTGLEYTYAQDELDQHVAAKEARSGPIGMGYRVPTIVASPWSRGGWVNSQLFDHTSTLMFLEDFIQKKFGKTVREDNISAWRRAICGDLTSCFRRDDEREPKLSYLDRDKFVVGIQQAKNKEVPSTYRKLNATEIASITQNPMRSEATAHQEPGIRPACALPYELYADGKVNADAKKFELRLAAGSETHGQRAAGAPFNVYLRNLQTGRATGNMQAATYAVKAGDALDVDYPLSIFTEGRYEIDVHGPNGFYRSFKGDAGDPGATIQVTYEHHGLQKAGNVQVRVAYAGTKPLNVVVKDHSYKNGEVKRTIASGENATVVLSASKSHGWYDFSVVAEGSTTQARFAGRIETGRSSFSDPLMGGVA